MLKRKNEKPIQGGRRGGESENPFLSARRTWTQHVDAINAQRKIWLIVSLVSLSITGIAVVGLINQLGKSQYIPYVIEVDKLGQARAHGIATQTRHSDPRIVSAAVSEWITDARTVTPDTHLMKKMFDRMRSKLSNADPAMRKIVEYTNANPLYERVQKEIVNVEIKSVMTQTPDTWQVDWIETIRDRKGEILYPPTTWRALVTVYVADYTPDTTDAQIRINPLGIFIRDYTWSRL